MLRRALASVRAQSFKDFEVIVVDNAGNSELASTCDSGSSTKVNFYRYTEKRGASAARNRGIEAARGRYICFLDDDDEYFPGMLAAVREFVCSPVNQPVDFCWCGIEKRHFVGGQQQKVSNLTVNPASVRDRSYVLRIGTGSGFCASAEALRAVGGFDEEMRVSEDRDLVLKLLEQGFSGKPLEQILHRRYYHDGDRLSTSQTAAEDARHDLMLLEKHADYLRRYPALRQKLLDQLGQNYCLAGDLGSAWAVALEAWRSSPLRLKAIRRLLRYSRLRLSGSKAEVQSNR